MTSRRTYWMPFSNGPFSNLSSQHESRQHGFEGNPRKRTTPIRPACRYYRQACRNGSAFLQIPQLTQTLEDVVLRYPLRVIDDQHISRSGIWPYIVNPLIMNKPVLELLRFCPGALYTRGCQVSCGHRLHENNLLRSWRFLLSSYNPKSHTSYVSGFQRLRHHRVADHGHKRTAPHVGYD